MIMLKLEHSVKTICLLSSVPRKRATLSISCSKMVEQEMDDFGVSEDDAMDYINYNAIRTVPYMKEKPPVIVYDMD